MARLPPGSRGKCWPRPGIDPRLFAANEASAVFADRREHDRRACRALGLGAVAVPLFEVEPLAWQVPDVDRFDGLLLTSANAIRHGGEGLEALRTLPVYAVGEATADAAREASFAIATTGEAGIDRLLDAIPDDLRLLHLCGEDRREPESRQHHAHCLYGRGRSSGRPRRREARRADHSRSRGPFAELSLIRFSSRGDQPAAPRRRPGRPPSTPPSALHDALLALAARLCNNPAGT